ncbi:F-box/FBD/LRR-repeat protein At1g13570-like isoform X4 [Lycium ferocissimum]|uniref:F-box/FBD/LRR-repeat protein At1g13570-like isoform X4 n=1 Tax=Lycium ferocissimum TaxID=112874 RepID=UPI0028160658|nr:F-box/FBD/LRR-repeat protein At1g13570-like isoform X4 [Lycium ferocissimum]
MILKLDVTNLKDITNKKGLVDSMMAPKKGRKHSCQTLPPDLLSNLPKNALDGILVRLPLREAVRTSILSKKWRYTWCKLPELTLDETLWETPADAGSLRWGRDLTFVTSNFTKIMYHILTLHAGPITKFTLSINSEYVDRKESHDIVKFFRSLSTIEHLHLEYMWFSACLGLDIPARLPFNLNRVKHFSLRFSLICLDEVLCTLCLIRSFPYLQYLKIEIVGNHDEDIPALECLEVEHFSDVTFNHLREVRLIMGTGSKPEMQLIKLLLAKSPLLVRMLIEAGMFEEFVPARIQESAAVQMLVKVAKFQRASPTAEVDLRLF